MPGLRRAGVRGAGVSRYLNDGKVRKADNQCPDCRCVAANGRSEPKLAKLFHRSERRPRSALRQNDGGGLRLLEGFAEDHLVVAFCPKVADTGFFFVAILSVELAR